MGLPTNLRDWKIGPETGTDVKSTDMLKPDAHKTSAEKSQNETKQYETKGIDKGPGGLGAQNAGV